ncbi:MAG: flagellar assembly protein FliW [Lachnospiraceae bacterium]|nr:flagellar assembly protein FliW [Lachnospiraceae bacterium]
MKANTRFFGEIEIDDDKIIKFEKGIIGFPDMKNFTLIFDQEAEDQNTISWLQSMDDADVAFPVLDPLVVCPDYNPQVEDELLKPLGELREDNLFVLVMVTVPTDIKQMTVNLKAPIVINTDTKKASQLIIDNNMPVKYNIYEFIKSAKEKAGE